MSTYLIEPTRAILQSSNFVRFENKDEEHDDSKKKGHLGLMADSCHIGGEFVVFPWLVPMIRFSLESSLFCSLQFCIVIFEFACLMVQNIVYNHGRFNATPTLSLSS